LPTGGTLSQADGTAWMAFYCLQMMQIAIELALHNPVYEQSAMKFFDHFIGIAKAMGRIGESGLWDEEDGFFYDYLNLPDGSNIPLKLRSMVGLIPLYAIEVIDNEVLVKLPRFHKHMIWYMGENPEIADIIPSVEVPGQGQRRLFSLVGAEKLERILKRLLDPNAFLSEYGIRAMSKEYEKEPYCFSLDSKNSCSFSVYYRAGESDSGMFGGNSNWRGPVWFPVNYLLFESLQRFSHYFGNDILVGKDADGKGMNLDEVAVDLAKRLVSIFELDTDGNRPVYEKGSIFNTEGFSENILFYEYFHGENGRGLGASHQTGWTGLVAKLIQSIHSPL